MPVKKKPLERAAKRAANARRPKHALKQASKEASKQAGKQASKQTRKPVAKQARKQSVKGSATAPAKRSAKPPAPRDAVSRLRRICLSLPETAEVEAWGEPTFRVKGKIFAMHASDGNHHGAGRPAVWILSVGVEQDFVVRARPDRYFKPPYVGPSGWIGAWLDRNPPWAEIEELIRDGWRRRAPKKIAALLGE